MLGVGCEWLYCQDCKSIFMKEDVGCRVERDVHYWLDDQPVEEWVEWFCPECGSGNIEEADYCEVCGEVIIPEDSPDGLCEECRKREGGKDGSTG